MKAKYIVLLSLMLSFSLVHFGQAGSAESQSADSTTVKKNPKAIHVVNINFEIDRTRRKLLKMANDLETKPEFVQLDSLSETQKVFIEKEAEEFKQLNPYNLSKYFLENTFRAWSSYRSRLDKWLEVVNGQLTQVQENFIELEFDKEVWRLSYENEKSAEDPAQLTEKILTTIKDIEDLQLQFAKQRREMIIREDNISDIILIADGILEEVSELQQYQRENLFVANKPSLWEIVFDKSEILPILPRLKKAWRENAKTVRNFSNETNYISPLLFILLIAVMFFLIGRAYRKLGLSDQDPNFVVVRRIFFDHPYATTISFSITIIVLFYATLPLILTGLLGIILLICAMIFLPGMIGKQGKVIVLVVLILNVVNLSEIVFWYFGNYSRIYITAEALLALYLTYKYGLQGFKKMPKNAAPFVKEVWILSVLMVALFTVALISNIFGYMNLAVLMLKVGVKIAAIVVIVFGAHAILRAIIFAVIEIGRNTKSKVMEKRWDALEKRSIQLVNILAIVVLVKYILQNMEIYRPVINWLTEFLAHNWEIGTLHISIGGIFSLVLILGVSFGLSNFFKVIIEDEFLVRTKLPKGVPAAISVTIRYFIIVLGLTMALSAAGIDLGSFGLLAGALGVGIGFGLQNIVNNFISGLILVYERPVNVGDTVEVETLMGVVHRIGVRSSNVRTFDGAEVVVPNGNLISNQLINWTLSDNQRRIEVKVGTAYGTDPNVVLELMEKVALDHEDVLKDPKPRALFEGFGDSSLNFRLLLWVHFERGLGVQSDIAIGIYNIFDENNIEIPFPQIDLHVKKEDDELLAESKPKKKTAKKIVATKEKLSNSESIDEPNSGDLQDDK